MRSVPASSRNARSGTIFRATATCALVLLLAACGSTPTGYDETAKWSADELYDEAKTALEDGIYDKAIKYYERLEARFPFGRYAQQAQIEIAYTHYKAGDVADAIAACERFIRLYPNHQRVDYVYYLKGLSSFSGNLGFLGGLGGQDPTERDPKGMRDAFDAFKTLVTRFPESIYAEEATRRMAWLVNALASHEIHVARYYFSRTAYLASANRAQMVIRSYPDAPAIEDALVIMIASYDKLGLTDLRDDSEKVMRLNYPDSLYYQTPEGSTAAWWTLANNP